MTIVKTENGSVLVSIRSTVVIRAESTAAPQLQGASLHEFVDTLEVYLNRVVKGSLGDGIRIAIALHGVGESDGMVREERFLPPL